MVIYYLMALCLVSMPQENGVLLDLQILSTWLHAGPHMLSDLIDWDDW